MIKEYRLKCSDGYRVMCETYNSAQAVVHDCKKRKITDRRFHDMQDGNLGEHEASWCGVKNYEDALELLKNGSQTIVEKFKNGLKVNLHGHGERISFHNDIVGYAPVVPLAIIGVPNSMINSIREKIKTKVVDVYYDISAGCEIDSDDIMRASMKILSAIVELEQSGYRFNLYAVQTYSRKNDCDMLCVKVKDAQQPLDLKRVSFPLAHAGFLRVIGFDWYSRCPKTKYVNGYGQSLYDRKGSKCKEMVKEMFGDNAIYISCAKLTDNLRGAEQYLKEVLSNAKSN